MKETPILFSGPMVKAILRGSKTQTRRIVKPQPDPPIDEALPCYWYAPTKVDPRDGEVFPGPEVFGFGDAEADWPCPYGGPGGKLWVREAWAKHPEIEACTCYRADAGHKYDGLQWKPSIHLPRDRCRITLEITGVKVERLHDISEEDAKAEGIRSLTKDGSLLKYWACDPCEGSLKEEWSKLPKTAIQAFSFLWESIHGKGSWNLNPLVWCIEWPRWTP